MVDRVIPGCRMVATSNGSECGRRLAEPGAELFRLEANFYANRIIWPFAGLGAGVAVGIFNPANVGFLPRVGLGILTVPIATILTYNFFGTNWKTQIVVNALPNLESKKVLHGRIDAEKRFFGLFKLFEYNIWKAERYSTTLMPAWDVAPGGTYSLLDADMRQTIQELNPNINAFPFVSANLRISGQEEFCFVPTYSALDIQTNNNPIAVTTPYNGVYNGQFPSRFANFIAQETDRGTGLFNNGHIAYTARNARWMFREMEATLANAQGIQPNITCSNECPSTNQFSIAGQGVFCTNSVFSVNGLPQGSVVNWSATGSISINSTGVATAIGGGWGTVRATFNTNCASNLTASRSVWAGKPTVILPNNPIIIETPCRDIRNNCDCPSASPCVGTASVYIPGATSYTVNGQTVAADVNGYCTFTRSGTVGLSQTYTIRGANSCGTSAEAISVSFRVIACADGLPRCPRVISGRESNYDLRIFPNPVENEINITWEDNTEDEEIVIKLLNKYNQVVYEKQVDKRQPLKIETKNLPNDVYFLHIASKNDITRKQILVSK